MALPPQRGSRGDGAIQPRRHWHTEREQAEPVGPTHGLGLSARLQASHWARSRPRSFYSRLTGKVHRPKMAEARVVATASS